MSGNSESRHGPVRENAEGWIRATERRMGHEERRPNITKASDVLGPGIGPQAVEVTDWEDGNITAFNGVLYSQPGAANTPPSAGGTVAWMGTSFVDELGFGFQAVWNYRDAGAPEQWVRRFFNAGTGVLFTGWVQAI